MPAAKNDDPPYPGFEISSTPFGQQNSVSKLELYDGHNSTTDDKGITALSHKLLQT
jgi:hypothetical protein